MWGSWRRDIRTGFPMSKAKKAIDWPVYMPRKWGASRATRPLPRPWFGLDTEREAKPNTGEFVTGWCSGDAGREFCFGEGGLGALPSGSYWVYNLGYDLEGMVRDLAEENGWAMKTDGAPFEIGGVKCVYYHGKRFDWGRGKERKSFLEASSFFGRIPLQKAAKAIGGSKKGLDASEMSLERYLSDPIYRLKVDEYCLHDARLVYRLIALLDEGCKAIKPMGVELGATPGATARRFISRLGEFPRVLWDTKRGFLRSYCGGRFEITKWGFMEGVYQYDIVSAYVYALSRCPWLTKTAYHRHANRYSPGALYGSYEVSFKTDDYLGVAPGWKGDCRVYSKGEKAVWIARPELEFLMERGVDVEIRRGVEIFDENAEERWGDATRQLFELKQNGAGKPEGYGAKTVMVSMYGVLIQLVRKSGEWVSVDDCEDPVDFVGDLALTEGPKAFEGGHYLAPAYAGHLTSLTRCMILEAGEAVGEGAYIGGHTDSLLATKPLPEKFLGDGLGKWKLENKGPEDLIVTKTGMYALGDKVKMRGITRDARPEVLLAERHERRTRIGVKTAKGWDDVSRIVTKNVANNLRSEKKRKWERDLTREVVANLEFVDSGALEYVGGR
jgi:hypothetical protein